LPRESLSSISNLPRSLADAARTLFGIESTLLAMVVFSEAQSQSRSHAGPWRAALRARI
jgi:hypothetical protein